MVDDTVRKLIREVLAEELQRVKADTQATPGVREETVAVASDADLAAFVARLMKLAGDAKARRDIERGRVVFRLAGNAPRNPAAAEPAPAGDTVRMDRGVVSERQVDALPKGTRILLAGKNVKLTPLAKDRLRQRGIKIERTG
ncbi:MAG: hypothetical protein IMF05_15900 [Proteobacteria bacterium]|nr:hypothetical protein [Pseudomonadota bacterium]